MKYLGIDYGKSKVGLAISEGLTASPLKIVKITSLKDALQKVLHEIKTESVDQVIIGLPDSGESRQITERFVKGLEKQIPVTFADETLSTYNSKGKNNEDAAAAALILQNYLENHAR